jgi:predicted XRE-type DNA-binding protein
LDFRPQRQRGCTVTLILRRTRFVCYRNWRIIYRIDEDAVVIAEETALIEIKLSLARSLRERRQKRMTQAQLAEKLKSSQPRVAKAEGGDATVSIELLIRAMLATGATPKQIGQAIAIAQGTVEVAGGS